MALSKRPNRAVQETATILASAARTADTGTSDPIRLPHCDAIAFMLDVTAAATAVDDTLAVFVQTLIDDKWVDVVAFTLILGNGGAKRYFGKVSAGLAEAMFENGAALAAGSVRHLIGDQWRARFVITDADTDNASFTFSVSACPI
jgi:hypothetical protein